MERVHSMFGKYLNVLQLISYLGDSIDGRKRLQKLVYLVQQMGGPFKEVFQYHLYGPFSEQLANELEEMKGFGLVREIPEPAYSGRKYKYSITEEGKRLLRSMPNSGLKPFEELIRDLGHRNTRDLELMATSLFLSKNARGVHESGIVKRVKDLKSEQEYSNEEIEESLEYLRSHGFLQMSNERA